MPLSVPHRLLTDSPQGTYAKPPFRGAACGKSFPQVEQHFVNLSK